jgi:CMP-N,N'-diacetyllegionaminic acid synthase
VSVLALVPARGGSKGVPGKNVKPLAGHPLLAYAIKAGLEAQEVDSVVVSTDSQEIADVARSYGAAVPFLRPAELATDAAGDLDFLAHALEELAPETIVLLRPTTPLREPPLIDEAVRMLAARADATSVRSVHELAEPPQKMLGIEDGLLAGLFPHDPRPEYYNLPRQSFAPAYHPNGYVDVLRAETIRGGLVYGPRALAFVTPHAVEVDRLEDFEYLEFVVSRSRYTILDRLGRG